MWQQRNVYGQGSSTLTNLLSNAPSDDSPYTFVWLVSASGYDLSVSPVFFFRIFGQLEHSPTSIVYTKQFFSEHGISIYSERSNGNHHQISYWVNNTCYHDHDDCDGFNDHFHNNNKNNSNNSDSVRDGYTRSKDHSVNCCGCNTHSCASIAFVPCPIFAKSIAELLYEKTPRDKT
ncbi:hypothetical protein MBLNU459_g5268t1 [Dothideomycetes sp. NU459]